MSDNKNQNVVIAIFDNKEWLEPATKALKEWDEASPEYQLGAIGTIRKEGGKVKTEVGHKAGSGAKAGVVVGIIAAVLSGGVTLIGGVLGGGALGGIAGAFFKKSLHLTKEEIESIGNELDAGKVALVVTCDDFEVEPVAEQLRRAGGTITTYTVPDQALEEAVQGLATGDEPSDDGGTTA